MYFTKFSFFYFLVLFVAHVQVCDFCDPSIPDKSHPAEYATDGTENWWQSPPLSRGMKYNEVNLTIDFGQVRIRIRLKNGKVH